MSAFGCELPNTPAVVHSSSFREGLAKALTLSAHSATCKAPKSRNHRSEILTAKLQKLARIPRLPSRYLMSLWCLFFNMGEPWHSAEATGCLGFRLLWPLIKPRTDALQRSPPPGKRRTIALQARAQMQRWMWQMPARRPVTKRFRDPHQEFSFGMFRVGCRGSMQLGFGK